MVSAPTALREVCRGVVCFKVAVSSGLRDRKDLRKIGRDVVECAFVPRGTKRTIPHRTVFGADEMLQQVCCLTKHRWGFEGRVLKSRADSDS